jgi:hypothetical protein
MATPTNQKPEKSDKFKLFGHLRGEDKYVVRNSGNYSKCGVFNVLTSL